MYFAKLDSGKKVIVKFGPKYCPRAHELLAEAGYDPELMWCEKVTSRFVMVVMEYIENALSLTDFIQKHDSLKESVLRECESALAELHDKQFCHGDSRENNILAKTTELQGISLKVIDFDWAGHVGEAVYPYFMNCEGHETAFEGKPLQKEHDIHWLEQFMR